jgi:hypothetical protein
MTDQATQYKYLYLNLLHVDNAKKNTTGSIYVLSSRTYVFFVEITKELDCLRLLP